MISVTHEEYMGKLDGSDVRLCPCCNGWGCEWCEWEGRVIVVPDDEARRAKGEGKP